MANYILWNSCYGLYEALNNIPKQYTIFIIIGILYAKCRSADTAAMTTATVATAASVTTATATTAITTPTNQIKI